MANLEDYLAWRGDVSFGCAPFNEVDNLILTQLVYLDFTGLVPGAQAGGVPLRDVARQFAATENAARLPPLTRSCARLLQAMAQSVRFGGCRLSGCVREVCPEQESQFAALCIAPEGGGVFVSFSGTDSSVAGWKENFNMSFLSETPGQRKALAYLTGAAMHCPGALRVGGHSKGGNQAVYAAMHLAPGLQRRLAAVYNNDGPGFTEKMISKQGWLAVRGRVHTFLPESSLIGLLLEHDERYRVVRSSGVGVLQHDAFTWQVQGSGFVYCDALAPGSAAMDKALRLWVGGLPDARRRQFVDALFSILERANIDDTAALAHLTWQQFAELLRAADSLADDDKAVLVKTLKALLDACLRTDLPEAAIAEGIASLRGRLAAWLPQRERGAAPAVIEN